MSRLEEPPVRMSAGRVKCIQGTCLALSGSCHIVKGLVGIFGQNPEGQCCPELYVLPD